MMQDVTCEIKSRIDAAKAAFKKNTLFASKVDFKLRQKQMKCCIWSTALYRAENWTHQKADLQYHGSSKFGASNGWGRPVGTTV